MLSMAFIGKLFQLIVRSSVKYKSEKSCFKEFNDSIFFNFFDKISCIEIRESNFVEIYFDIFHAHSDFSFLNNGLKELEEVIETTIRVCDNGSNNLLINISLLLNNFDDLVHDDFRLLSEALHVEIIIIRLDFFDCNVEEANGNFVNSDCNVGVLLIHVFDSGEDISHAVQVALFAEAIDKCTVLLEITEQVESSGGF